jgi:hypothetical protein
VTILRRRRRALIRALDTDLKWVRAHTRLLASNWWDADGRNNSFVCAAKICEQPNSGSRKPALKRTPAHSTAN